MSGPETTRILLIDDDDLSRAVLELHLSAEGYAVTEAESGDAAMALLVEGPGERYDVILSDLQMPGLHGPALAEALRAAVGAGTPLLAMSGSQPPAERYEGFDGFLLKPFTPAEFDEAVRGMQRTGSDAQQTTERPHATVLDEGTFAQLQGMMRPAQLVEIFALSLTELEKHRERMQRAFEEGDAAELQAAGHAMKGGFSVLGATELRDLGATLEAGTGTPADQTATLLEIPLAAERLRRMLTSRGLPVSATRSSGQETR